MGGPLAQVRATLPEPGSSGPALDQRGESQSSYHYEYAEEWLLVVDGTLVLRAPDGEHTVERGDAVCFPPGPA